jgi:hypothetical protein
MEHASLTFHLSQSIRSTVQRECVLDAVNAVGVDILVTSYPYGRLRLQKISGYMKDAGKRKQTKNKRRRRNFRLDFP